MALLLAAACTDYWLKQQAGDAVPDIRVDPVTVEDGICADTTVEIEVANAGDGILRVAEVTTDDEAWGVDGGPFEVDPGQRTMVRATGSDGTTTLRVRSNNPDTPEAGVTIGAAANVAPTVLVVSPYDEETLPAEGDVVLSAVVSDDDDWPGALAMEWVSSLTGTIATAYADASGVVTTTWPEDLRQSGPQWVTLRVTDPCGEVAEDEAWLCQDGPFVIYPIVEEAWRTDGTAVAGDEHLDLTDGTLEAAGSAFALSTTYDADDIDVAFAFRIDGEGGEGLSLTLLDIDRREVYVGGDGCGLGFGGGAGCTSGPALPGWSLEFDTREDEADCVTGPHVAFSFDGDILAPAACAPLPTSPEDGAWHTVHLRLLDAALTVEVDDTAVLEAMVDGYSAFQGVAGFTATTAETVVSHSVRDVAVTDYRCEW